MDLSQCSKFIVGVVPVGSTNQNRLPTNWLRIKTPFDARKPPANAQMKIEGKKIRFTWNHACRSVSQQPPYYSFSIHDLTMKTNATVRVAGLYRVQSIAHGAEYEFRLSTPAIGAQPILWHYKAPSLPTPANFHIASNDSGTYSFSWDAVDVPDEM